MDSVIIKGKVILAGAGPGDPDLVTVKTANYLQRADVVLTDRLVSEVILARYVKPSAEIVEVGKQCGKGVSTPQETINELLVKHALQGKFVVRLKGGDVSFFSNVLDELGILVANKIPYEIVPGVTAASGAAAYAGMPLTARDHATAVRFLTYYKSTAVSEAYWEELANTNDTLVFYMSSATLDTLVNKLMEYRIDNSKQIAVIEQATTAYQQVYISSVHEYENKLKGQAFLSPSLVIIGKVVGLHEQFKWFKGSDAGEPYFKPLTGILKSIANAEQKPVNAGPEKITIVYGTETGNSKRVAIDLTTKAKKNNFVVKLVSLDQYRLTDLAKEDNLLVVISTQGDGEPPVAAQKFYDHIHHNGFRLDNVKYSVLALGDTSYPLFCKAGEDVDAQLQRLGGKRIVPIQKCDLDYDADAGAWFNRVLQALNNTVVDAPVTVKTVPRAGIKLNTRKIHTGTVLSNINLNDRGPAKVTCHIELAAGDADYLPGDSIGIVPENPLATVNAIIALTEINKEKPVKHNDVEYTVFDLLKKKVNIHFLHERVVKKYAAIVRQDIPETKMDLFDLLGTYPVKDAVQFEEALQVLPAQSPRIYTIASSNAAHSGEIHLTVGKDRFVINKEEKTGVCSAYLTRLKEGSCFDFFVQKNKRFKLPAADKDMVMIGQGTGIAAFRSFLSERDATGATGKNWLFFGEEHFASDFLYQTEIQDWFETGVLTKVGLAFSNDQPEKLFVHDRVFEHGKELFDWINSGAYIYVCGEKTPMSIEVECTLLRVFEQYGGMDKESAREYFDRLTNEGRYSKDVY